MTTIKYATIIIVEDSSSKGHYYHETTLEKAIESASQCGCYAATAYCYDCERHTLDRSTASETIKFNA